MEKELRKTIKIYKSLTGIRAQLLDGGKVLVGRYFKYSSKSKPVEQSFAFGEEFGKLVKATKITLIAFDRSGSRYHGRVKSFADGLRKAGLEF